MRGTHYDGPRPMGEGVQGQRELASKPPEAEMVSK